jgi:hypothetical protein
MDASLLAALETTFRTHGGPAALDHLCEELRRTGDFTALFYALLMRKRHELGIDPVPTGPTTDVPVEHHEAFENAIREAGRTAGQLYLDAGNIPQAWTFFRMIGEPTPVRRALEAINFREVEDLEPLVQIAYYEGVHPMRGFDWILGRYGLCSAITTLGSQELPAAAAVRQHVITRVVQTLYQELRERLAADIERQGGTLPPAANEPENTPGVVRALMTGHDELFGEDAYHVDTSHLSSTVQLAMHLDPGPALELARELCEYGAKLRGRWSQPGDPPFEELYPSMGKYLAILAGDQVEENLGYFREQAEKADPNEVGTFPAEVLVNLLLRLGRDREALEVARKYLAAPSGRRLSCPSVVELCTKLGDYATLAETARSQGDAIHFLAGLLGKPDEVTRS